MLEGQSYWCVRGEEDEDEGGLEVLSVFRVRGVYRDVLLLTVP